MSALRIGVVCSHPIQYYSPVFRELARRCDLAVLYAHRQTASGQAEAGFGVGFEWDVDLLSGYEHRFLRNVAPKPDTQSFFGCNTPEVGRVIAEGRFDAVLVTGWNLETYWQAVKACRREGVPVMVRGDSRLGTPRTSVKVAAKRMSYPWLLGRFARCLYVGQRSREYFAHYGVPDSRLVFSPHCVDNDGFASRGDEQAGRAWRAAHGIAAERPVVLFVGKLIEGKRPADLIRAVGMLRVPERDRPVVVIAGEGGLRRSLEEMTADGGIDARFLGFKNQSELPAIYAAADVLVLPSASETWGLVVNEALACGTPAIVSDACGCAPDLIEPGRTGFTFPAGDVAALTAALGQGVRMKREATTRQAIAGKTALYCIWRAAGGVVEAAAQVSRRHVRSGALREMVDR